MTGKMPAILAIDDDPVVLALLETQLSGKRYRIFTESNPRRGLEVSRSFKPDLILLDLNMPDMSGFEVLKYLRKDPITQEIPVVMLTAISQKEAILDAIKFGINDYIIKPYTPDKLFAKISAVLQYTSMNFSAKVSESEYISTMRDEKAFIFSFPRGVKEKYFLIEAQKVFNSFLLLQMKEKPCVLDLRSFGEMDRVELQILLKVITLIKDVEVNIIAGRNYGVIVAETDIDDRANLFITFGDFNIYLWNRNV